MPDSAAFFDLDRTLISGASVFPIGIEAWRQGLASNSDLLKWAMAALSFKVIGEKADISDEVRGAFLTRLAGSPTGALNALSTAVLPKLVARVRPESRNLIAMHAAEGRDTWIVSASLQDLVEMLANSLRMSGAMGTRGKIVDGVYTGDLDGPFVYGAGKAEIIEKLAADRGYDLERCYGYSDSISDLAMMEAVGHPVAVNPDSELESVAHERGWPIVIFARKTKRAIAVSAVGAAAVGTAAASYLLGRSHGRATTLARLRPWRR